MTGEILARWSVLCTQVAEEQDLAQFLVLSSEIERLLEEKKQRLRVLRQRMEETKS